MSPTFKIPPTESELKEITNAVGKSETEMRDRDGKWFCIPPLSLSLSLSLNCAFKRRRKTINYADRRIFRRPSALKFECPPRHLPAPHPRCGAGLHYHAFWTAFRIPNLLRDLFAEGALSAAFVTTFSQVLAKKGEAE